MKLLKKIIFWIFFVLSFVVLAPIAAIHWIIDGIANALLLIGDVFMIVGHRLEYWAFE